MKDIELLAPVGNMEALYLAIINGADAIYLGGKTFNARQYASNFDDENLKSAVEFAHIMGVKVYVTLNILIKEKEIEDVIDYIVFLYNIDVDALIIQDIGLLKIIKKILPDFEIHGSTQMTINNLDGVKLLEKMGFSRVVLARELSVNEIKYIKNNSNIELEGFIHGALCISYSGQCLMSSLIGGRSGNRGRCAQPCRMKYSLLNLESNEFLKGLKNKNLLSTKDLNTIDNLEDIINSGITSLKIEGRMKRPEYVATIVSKYRKKLDYLLGNSMYDIDEKDKREIRQIFNREFTKGFISGEKNSEIVNLEKSNNMGVRIGKVIGYKGNNIRIKLNSKLRVGDGIEVRNDFDSSGLKINRLFNSQGKQVNFIDKDEIAEIKFKKKFSKNSNVYKTSDIELLKKSKNPIRKGVNGLIPINIAIELKLGEYPKLFLWDNEGNYVEVYGENIVEKGRNITLTEEKVLEQLSKLGNTLYWLKSSEINIDKGIMVRARELNFLRRKAVEKLNVKRAKKYNRKKEDYSYENLLPNSINKKCNKNISVKVQSIEQFQRVDLSKLNRIYLTLFEGVKKAIEVSKEYSIEIYLSLDKIIHDDNLKIIKERINELNTDIDGISVSNLGILNFVIENYNKKIHCDIGINIFNSISIQKLEEFGVSSITLSPELTKEEVKDIYSKTNLNVEIIGYGYLPVMVTKYSPLLKDDKINEENYALVDRKNMKFRFKSNTNNTTIYNSQPMFIADKIDNSIKFDFMRLDFNFNDELIEDVQRLYYDSLKGNYDKNYMTNIINNLKNKVGITKGHLFRGVL